MTLAYTFWHRPRADVSVEEYESGLQRFHRRLAAVPIPGFVDSWTLRVPDRPWLAGGGYEDWYLIDGFAALGTLTEHAVDADRAVSHDAMARSVRDGAGGVYAHLAGELGETGTRGGWCGWFSKPDGVHYRDLRATLEKMVDAGTLTSVWQRQLVLGPAPEFRLLAPAPIAVSGADLQIGGPLSGSISRSISRSISSSASGSASVPN